ncbi:efflux RND transporter permease subunit [Lederbergia citri]|uniref:Efflux RND transporter permease subunit n=1 Tax=Lederbergia citri TaxID=2833580 RepID=A0A942THA2_9BACI|nr:efflux RND transporter permease subunit [Lederbergia citri]MBS4196918.1 efflux RND transporter permease subunit [Lederbergia citri]
MEKLISSLKQRLVLLFVIILLIFVWGWYSATQLKKEYLPPINNSTLMVTLKTSPHSIDEKKQHLLSKEITENLKDVEGLQSIESTLYPQGIFISISFPQNMQMEEAEKTVKAALQNVELPSNTSKPEITKINSNSFPFMQLSFTSKTGENVQSMNTEEIQKQLELISGVKKIESRGNGRTGFVITLDNNKLLLNGIKFADVQAALENKAANWPLGKVQLKNLQLLLNVEESPDNQIQLENLVVKKENDRTVLLKDVGTIKKSFIQMETIVRTNAQPSVLLSLYHTSSADITKVSENVMKELKKIQSSHPDVETKVLVNQGETISQAINGLWKEGALGSLFSMLCVFFFFREWRSTVAIILALPICFLTTVSILLWMDISLNLLTVSGLIVSMGRVVDDSIVVLDNMYRKIEKNGKYSLSVLSSAVKEMIPAVVSSTLTTIAVYLPLTITGTMVGDAFFGFAWTVTISLVCSLLVSLLLLPPYAAYTWERGFTSKAQKIEEWFKPILERLWIKRSIWFTGLCVVLLLSIVGALFTPVNVFPRSHAKDVNIQIEAAEGATIDQINGEVRELESLLMKNEDIQTFTSSIGSSFTPTFDDVFDQAGGWIEQPNVANVYVTPQQGVDMNGLISEIKDEIKRLSTSSIITVSNQQIAGDDSRVRLVLSGSGQNELIKAAGNLKSKLQNIEGLQIYGEGEQGEQVRFTVELIEEKISSLGIDKEVVLTKVESLLDKQENLQINNSGIVTPILLHKPSDVSLTFNQVGDPNQELLLQIGRLPFKDKKGKNIALYDIAKLNVSRYTTISEKDGQPIAIVTGNILTKDIGGVTKKIKNVIDRLDMPKGIDVEFGGIPLQVQQMIWSIGFGAAISILLVLIIVTTVFKGIRGPVAVLSSLPFALIGSVTFLFLFRQSWNLGALAGLIMLIGIVTTNGIVLVDRLERLRESGKDLYTTVIQGTASRVRPVLMTAATTVFTLLPLAFFGQNDTLISQSLGLVVVGGLITSTLSSLFIVPVIYYWLWNGAAKTQMVDSMPA